MRVLGCSLVLMMVLCACGAGGEDGGGGGGTGTPGNAPGAARYVGSATIQIGYGGSVETLHLPAWAETAAPVSAQSIGNTGQPATESNPFNFSVGTTDNGGQAAEGEFFLLSARSAQVDLGPTPVLLQYWNLAVSGTTLSGTLVDTHRAESMALNQLWAVDEIGGDPFTRGIYSFLLNTNCTLDGTVTDTQVRVLITGWASSAGWLSDCWFSIEVVASRS